MNLKPVPGCLWAVHLAGQWNKSTAIRWYKGRSHGTMKTLFHLQVVIEADDRQPLPSEGGFAIDDLMLVACEYPLPVDPGACETGNEQCDSGECYPATRLCDFTPDCCDGSDEDKQNCCRFIEQYLSIKFCLILILISINKKSVYLQRYDTKIMIVYLRFTYLLFVCDGWMHTL